MDRLHMSKITIYANAENLVTFSKYKEADPESLVNRNDLYTYPMMKTFTAGVNVTF